MTKTELERMYVLKKEIVRKISGQKYNPSDVKEISKPEAEKIVTGVLYDYLFTTRYINAKKGNAKDEER